MRGYRKLALGFYYLTGMFAVCIVQLAKGISPVDWTGLGVLAGGLATGVGVIVWGNAQEHKAQAGRDS